VLRGGFVVFVPSHDRLNPTPEASWSFNLGGRRRVAGGARSGRRRGVTPPLTKAGLSPVALTRCDWAAGSLSVQLPLGPPEP
jgi:hypothetical protein